VRVLASGELVALLFLVAVHIWAFQHYYRRFFALLSIAWTFHGASVLAQALSSPRGGSPKDSLPTLVFTSAMALLGGLITYGAIRDARFGKVAPTSHHGYWPPALATVLVLGGVISAWLIRPAHPWLAHHLALLPACVVACASTVGLALEYRRRQPVELLALLRQPGALLAPKTIVSVDVAHDASYYLNAQYAADRIGLELAGPRARRARFILVLSLLSAAALQIGFMPYLDLPGWYFIALHALAILITLIHVCGVALLLFADHQFAAALLHQRSMVEELGVLTASMEHDIRNPLSNLRKLLVIINGRYQHDTRLLRYSGSIRRELDRVSAAAAIIPALRETEAFIALRSQRENLVDLVRSAAKAVRVAHTAQGEKDPRLVFMPAGTIHVRAVRNRLVQVFVNLLNNSIEAMRERDPAKAPAIQISFVDSRRDGVVSVMILDSGVGIAPHLLPVVTQPFFTTKLDGSTNRGLGLFIASRFVEHHGGQLRFESDGSTFTRAIVTLPSPEVEE